MTEPIPHPLTATHLEAIRLRAEAAGEVTLNGIPESTSYKEAMKQIAEVVVQDVPTLLMEVKRLGAACAALEAAYIQAQIRSGSLQIVGMDSAGDALAVLKNDPSVEPTFIGGAGGAVIPKVRSAPRVPQRAVAK